MQCIQLTHVSYDDCEHMCTLSYYHHQIGSMTHLSLLKVRSYIYIYIYMYIWHIITYSCPNLRQHVSIKETLDMSHWGNPKESSPMLSWVHYCKIWTQSSKQIKCDTPGSQYLWISLLELVRDWYKISRNTTYLFLIMCLHQDSGAWLEVYSSLCLTKLCIISLLTSRDNVIIVMIIHRLNI